MKNKKSFIMYTDYQKHINRLSDEEAGRLIKAVLEQDGNACYDPDYLSDLKRRIERRRYNESKQARTDNQAQQQSHMGLIGRKKQKERNKKKDVDDHAYRFKCFGDLR